MGKVKFDAETEKTFNASFDNENSGENQSLNFTNDAKLLRSEESENSKDYFFVNLLKQFFFFLPGTFFLFFMSFAAAMIAMEIVVFGRAIETFPDDYAFQFALIGSIMILGTFMTWFGLGDIKNKKHFVIPASIFVTGATLGAIVRAGAKISDLFDRILDDFNFLIYLFPLALIVPVLAKGWVDRHGAKNSDAV